MEEPDLAVSGGAGEEPSAKRRRLAKGKPSWVDVAINFNKWSASIVAYIVDNRHIHVYVACNVDLCVCV